MKNLLSILFLSLSSLSFSAPKVEVTFTKPSEFSNVYLAKRQEQKDIIDMGSCGFYESARYLTLWTKEKIDGHKTSFAAIDIQTSEVSTVIEAQKKKNRYPALIVATPGNPNLSFTIIFEDKYSEFKFLMKEDEFAKKVNAYQGNASLHPVSISEDNGWLAYIMSSNGGRKHWRVDTGKTISQFLTTYNTLKEGGIYPDVVRLGTEGQYYTIYSDAKTGGRAFFQYKTVEEFLKNQQVQSQVGYELLSADCSGVEGESNFKIAAIYSKELKVRPKTFSSQGKGHNTLDAPVSEWMKGMMISNNMRNASLAIVSNGKLVFAKGYNNVEAGEKQISENSVSRFASISKSITALGIQKLVQEGKLSEEDLVSNILQYKTPQGGNAKDSRWYKVKVKHLLNHSGGWDRTEVSDLPTLPYVASVFKKSYPVTPSDVIRTKLMSDMQFEPGTKVAYSNLGYMILGRVMEVVTRTRYNEWMRENIFKGMGLSNPTTNISGYLKDSDPTEPFYIDPTLRTGISQADNSGAELHLDYNGGGDFRAADSFGGWVMKPLEYSKVLATMYRLEVTRAIVANAPLSTGSAKKIFSPVDPAFPNALHGFWISETDQPRVQCREHGGLFAGLTSYSCIRTDGIGFVLTMAKGGASYNKKALHSILSDLVPKIEGRYDLFPTYGIPSVGF